jgi:hypothetical protein
MLAMSGCVAAVVPVVAGGLVAKGELNRRGDRSPAPVASQSPAVPAPAQSDPAPSAPAVSVPAQGYVALAAYAFAHSAKPAAGESQPSALLDQSSLGRSPRLLACGNVPPAVVIDLDPAGRAFDPDDPPRAADGLAATLEAIRAAGVTVLWTASVRVEAAPKVYTVLQATGLDPDRTDRLLLLRQANDRKQSRREVALRDWCIVAIAGDARGDFDELFDYLVDPDGPMAAALAPNFGNGWFLVPTPIS